MDHLTITPMSTISSINLLYKFNIKQLDALEEKVVNVGTTEASFLLSCFGVEILKASLWSDTLLTDVFLAQKARKKRSRASGFYLTANNVPLLFLISASATNLYSCSHHKNGIGRMYVANDPKSLCPACSHVFEPKLDSCESRVHPQVREIMSRELLLSLCLTSSKFRMLGFLKRKSLIWEWMR
ncbi:hypothetical protein Gorai_006639 [Gossypium raimondii]|uniref:Uncharacterized protein n=1 Tax=Gossypium raimondii TaxID=29730 RepID=A0A7J8QH51_GOSRA|nr:hypothetical protein [Gossypium raimondii]